MQVAEREVQEEFTIANTYWYIIVSVTTTGYGDFVAKTILGKVIIVVAIVVGMLNSALLVTAVMQVRAVSRQSFGCGPVAVAE